MSGNPAFNKHMLTMSTPRYHPLLFVYFDCKGAPLFDGATVYTLCGTDQLRHFCDSTLPSAATSVTVYMTCQSSAWMLTLSPADGIDLQVQFTVLVPWRQLVETLREPLKTS